MQYEFKVNKSVRLCLAALFLLVITPQSQAQQHKWYIKVGKNGGIGFMPAKDFPSTDERLAGINKAITEILETLNVPGASVAVVEKNKVILAKGFGYKDLRNKIPVTENTLFPIGSCTKAFTAALLGTFADEKRIDLDQPVHTYLPELQFADPELTEQVTLRDMMIHRTGLPRHDLAWYLNIRPSSRTGLLQAIRYLEASSAIRETWQYNNFMYLAQGVVAEKLTSKSWEELLTERLLAPLGMQQAVLSTPDLLKNPDHALGYFYDAPNQAIEESDFYFFTGMEPAGSISVNATDMVQWLKLWTHGGQQAGKTIFSDGFYQQAIRPQMAMTAANYNPELDSYTYGYGLGWMIKSHKGHYFVEHGGNINGFSATTGFFPFDSIGIYVCVNQGNSVAQAAIRNWIADRMLKVTKTNWLKELAPPAVDAPAKPETDPGKIAGTQPSHALAEYAGIYLHKGYGEIGILLHGNQLLATIGKDTAAVKHYHYDVFTLILDTNRAPGDDLEVKIRFHTGYDGVIDGFDGQFEPALPQGIRFSRQPSKVEVPAGDLAKYTGLYSLGGMDIKVYLQGNSLRLLVPGQPEYELAPAKPDEFKITVADGFFVRFEMKDGKAVAADLVQPDGTYKMTRK